MLQIPPFIQSIFGQGQPQQPSAPAQKADQVKKAAEKALKEACKAIEKKSGLVRLVVHGAQIVCDKTIPAKKINTLLVPDPRPTVEGKTQANVSDVAAGKNIKPWPCKCKLRPKGPDYLPCKYQPGGLWVPGATSQIVNQDMPNAKKAMEVAQKLMQDGFSPDQAAGIIGNIQTESDFFRADTEYGRPNAGRGWIQWTGGRRAQFESWAASKGLSPTSDAANYGYLQAEMAGINGNHWTSWDGYSLDGFKDVQGVDKATDYFLNGYERPGVPHRDRRIANARKVSKLMRQLALPEVAKLKCAVGGTISIVHPGQCSKSIKLS